MRPSIRLTPWLPWLALLASCSAPPKPPTVDESSRRPVNTAMAVELQVCKSDLQQTQLRAVEAERMAKTAAATQAHLSVLQQALRRLPSEAPATRPNRIVTVYFDYGSTRVDLPPATLAWLGEAKAAPLVLLRGRTDGQGDAPAESRIARARAEAVSAYLVAAGVHPSRIRATHQPSGDHAADNQSREGRALNRRVEIEIYRALPVTASASEHTGAGSAPNPGG